MQRRVSVLLMVIVLGLGMLAATGCQQAQAGGNEGKSAASGQQAPGGTAQGRQNQGGNGGQANRQFGNFGTVQNVRSSGFTLVSQSGQLQVITNGDTRVTKISEVKTSDLKVGDSIFATGTQQADGSMVATSIQVGAADSQPGMGGGFPGAQGQPGPGGQRGQNQGNGSNPPPSRTPRAGAQGSQVSRLNGAIEAIEGDTITIKSQSGSSDKVTVGAETVVRKSADGSLSDIKDGETVVVNGQRNSDGAIVAVSVQLASAGSPPGQ